MLHKQKEFSVFSRLFLLYSLVLLIIYSILVSIFVTNIRQSSEDLIETKQSQTSNYLKTLEDQLSNMYTQQVNLMHNSNLTKLAYQVYEDNYEKNELVLSLMTSIEDIRSLNPMIEDIIVTFPGENITLSAVDGYEKASQAIWHQITSGSEYNRLVAYDDQLILNFTYPLMFSDSEDYEPDVNIQIRISMERLSQELEGFGDNNGNGLAILFPLESRIIVTNTKDGFVKSNLEAMSEQDYEDTNESIRQYEEHQYVYADSHRYPLTVIGYVNNAVLRNIQIRYIAVLTILMLFISGMYAASLIYTKKIVVKPINEMIQAFKAIQSGRFDVRIYHEPHDEFNYLYNGFNESVSYIQELIENIYEQERLLQNAELAQLQSQINPHFLYNSFFIINRMAKNESYELITKFVSSLAKYYRFINKQTQSFIPLGEEVAHMQNYIDIQQIRFEDKIQVVHGKLPEEMVNIEVPKLILQPIVENAYNYGMANILENGIIQIAYSKMDDYISIIVEDSGGEASQELVSEMNEHLRGGSPDEKSHALYNINKRLELAYGKGSGIVASVSHLGGVKITLKIKESIIDT